MLEAVRNLATAAYLMVRSAYLAPSFLVWRDQSIIHVCTEGVQQFDPLGPLLFCLSIHLHCTSLKSAFCVMYLDWVMIAGYLENFLHDLNVVK